MAEFQDEEYYAGAVKQINKATKVIEDVSENPEDPTRVALDALRQQCIILVALLKQLNRNCNQLQIEHSKYISDLRGEMYQQLALKQNK